MSTDMYLLGSVLLHEYAYLPLPCSFKLSLPVSDFLDTGIGFLEVSMAAL